MLLFVTVEPALRWGDASGLLGLGMGALMLAGGLAEHRRARRAEAATPADADRTAGR